MTYDELADYCKEASQTISELDCKNRILEKSNEEYKTQQKEFIKYLEDEINSISCSKSLQLNGFDVESIVKPYREVLQKYKEIIEDDKNER